MIEHTVDIISYFNECSILLRDGGILSMAIPDKRYCFDFLRPVSTIKEAVDSRYIAEKFSKKYHMPGTACEYILNVCFLNKAFGWVDDSLNGNFVPNLTYAHNMNYCDDSLAQVYKKACDDSEYMDFHHWVFTKSSFELMVYDLRVMGLINFKIEHTFDT